MTTVRIEYKCPSCDGPVTFDYLSTGNTTPHIARCTQCGAQAMGGKSKHMAYMKLCGLHEPRTTQDEFADVSRSIEEIKGVFYEILEPVVERLARALQGDTTAIAEFEQVVRSKMRKHDNVDQALANWALGLAGESGEVADIIKKHLFHSHDLDTDAITKEIGDVLWYVAALCETIGISMEDAMRTVTTKLEKRYPEGFDPERSKNREV